MSRRTPWAEQLDRELPLPEYPRPQLVREHWQNLNGVWSYAFTPDALHPAAWQGEIVVPFSPEAALSGVGRQLQPDEHLWYRRMVRVPGGAGGGRLLLHFGAVDQRCRVLVDGRPVGGNRGGYLPFTLDVTAELGDGAEHELVVDVVDPSDTSYHSRGKQALKRGGIWYTAQSGIWQTVWLERVPLVHVRGLRVRPLLESDEIEVVVEASAPLVEAPASPEASGAGVAAAQTEATVVVSAEGREIARATVRAGEPVRLPLPGARRWHPDDPFLHDLEVALGDDRVTSYFGMRSVGVAPDATGTPRLVLNGEPILHAAVLDQGYWPDGLYTAPSDAALVHDIEQMKALGFNALRKHIKIEPLRWYHHCDRLGMLVWQDLVNGGRRYHPAVVTLPVKLPLRLDDRRHRAFGRQDAEGRAEFAAELDATVRLLGNAPSVVVWVPFNEGWGQFDSLAAVARLRELDPGRVVDHASGWHDQGGGDLKSLHVYFRRLRPGRSWRRERRAIVVSEYGGYSLRLPGHEFGPREFGYRRYRTIDELTEAFAALHRDEIAPAIDAGLGGYVYTQLADVEDELNGVLTADRTVVKLRADRVRAVNAELAARFAAAVAAPATTAPGATGADRAPVTDRKAQDAPHHRRA